MHPVRKVLLHVPGVGVRGITITPARSCLIEVLDSASELVLHLRMSRALLRRPGLHETLSQSLKFPLLTYRNGNSSQHIHACVLRSVEVRTLSVGLQTVVSSCILSPLSLKHPQHI